MADGAEGVENLISADGDVIERGVIALEGDIVVEVAERAIFDQQVGGAAQIVEAIAAGVDEVGAVGVVG